MEVFLPSVFIVILALGVVIGIFPRLTPFFLVMIALTLLVLAAYNHYTLFGLDYRIQTWGSSVRSFAPIILIGTVVIFSGGYLLYILGQGGAGSASLPKNAYSPPSPPDTATNVVTESIARAMLNRI